MTQEFKISEPILLADLRWFVEQTKNLPDEIVLTIEDSKQLGLDNFRPASISIKE